MLYFTGLSSSTREMSTCVFCDAKQYQGYETPCCIRAVCAPCMARHAYMWVDRKCQACSKDEIYNKAWVFVDDSNLWIEGMKLRARQLNFDAPNDPRVRVNMTRLADVIGKSHSLDVRRGVLYGSMRSAAEAVWARVRGLGWTVKTHRRSAYSGREKQVDAQIIADIVELVAGSARRPGTIVLVSGDADMLPALEKATEHGWRVIVTTWAHCVAKCVEDYALATDSVEIFPLDAYADEVTFAMVRFPDRQLKLPKTRSFVLPGLLPNYADNAVSFLDRVSRWPWQIHVSDETKLVVAVIFAMPGKRHTRASTRDLSNPDIAAIITRVKRALSRDKEAKSIGLSTIIPVYRNMSTSLTEPSSVLRIQSNNSFSCFENDIEEEEKALPRSMSTSALGPLGLK